MATEVMQGSATRWQKALLLALLLWPWLNPFAPGPSPQVLPLLTAWSCLAGLLLFWQLLTPKAVAGGWLLAGVISTVIALCQYFGVASTFAPWMNQTDPGNIFANLRQRNQFASLTSIALVALIWFVMQTKEHADKYDGGHAKYKMVWAMAAVLLGVGNALSSSRTGLVQLVFLSALLLLWPQWRVHKIGPLMGIVWAAYVFGSFVLPALTGSSLMGQGIFSRLATESPACASRRILWSNVLHLIGQKPWLGWGWGELDYAHFVTLFSGPRFCEIADNAHNLPLQLAVELGVPLALLVCGAFMAWVVHQKPWQETSAVRQSAWGVLLVIGLHSLLEYPLWYGPFQIAALLCLWLLWSSQKSGAKSNIGHWRPQRFALAVVVLPPLLFLGWAMWDYYRISQIYLPVQARMPAYRSETLQKIGASLLFKDQVQFAELTLTPVTASTAVHLNTLAHKMLHFSPEARVATKLIESALVLSKKEEAAFYAQRLQAAFPEAYQEWLATQSKAATPQ